MNAVATAVRRVLKMDSVSPNSPACKRAAHDGAATRQLHFVYRPVIHEKPLAGPTAGLPDRWLLDRAASMVAARPISDFRDCAAVPGKADRFCLGHAASALKNLQSVGIAGRTVVHLSTSCLMNPMLPVYVIGMFLRRGVRLDGVTVAFVAGRRRRPSGRPLHDAALESPTYVACRTHHCTNRQASWVDALLGRQAKT